MSSLLVVIFIVGLSYTFLLSSIHILAQQPLTQDFVEYEKDSNFIKEFRIPIEERGLKGLTADRDENVWFYHSTSNSSMIMKMSKDGINFTKYPIPGNTIADSAIINLAGGQLLFDNSSNVIWFTDARINSLGKLDIKTSKIELFSLPTTNSGIMGLALSPDRKLVWFTEITGNKIGSLDIEGKTITEYPTGENSGPTLLTFDSKGVLWVTLSYANSILRVEPWLLVPGSKSIGMYSISLQKPDFFSPFGVATTQVKGIEKIFLSDHGSSRVIASNISSELKNYTSYWTSPSRALPMALPSQVVSDKAGNVFFVEHGGNKIGKISSDNGMMTEFDIPTGPLATSVFLAVSENGKRVWFTEWESSKIGYLDNTFQIPLTMVVRSNADIKPIILKQNDSHSVDVSLTLNKNTSYLVLPNATEVSVVGMTDAGLKGILYSSKPERVNLTAVPEADVKLDLKVESEQAVSGNYTTMIRASLLEKDGLILSLLYPQLIKLDVPNKPLDATKTENFQEFLSENPRLESSGIPFIGLIRTGAIAIVLLLVGYLLYRKVGKRIKFKKIGRR